MSHDTCPALIRPGAKYLFIGDVPSVEEASSNSPFSDSAGELLFTLLRKVGVTREDCSFSYLCKKRPPGNDIEHFFLTKTEAKKQNILPLFGKYPLPLITEGLTELHSDIQQAAPSVIITLGNAPMWALTGESGITSWRGSNLSTDTDLGNLPIVPTYHPSAIMRKYEWHIVALHDFQKAVKVADRKAHTPQPKWDFKIRPSFEVITSTLSSLLTYATTGPLELAADIETSAPTLACLGLAWSPQHAICIPFFSGDEQTPSLYSFEEMVTIVTLLRELLMHPNVEIIGQNFSYDIQYLFTYLGITPARYLHDTMIAHHTLYPSLQKGLDFLSSIYLPDTHLYWKSEGKEFDYKRHPPERLWTYNCKDACITWAIWQELKKQIHYKNVQHLVDEQMAFTHRAIKAMLKGVAYSKSAASEAFFEVSTAIDAFEQWLGTAIPFSALPVLKNPKTAKPWYRSPTQQVGIFYGTLGYPPIFNPKTGAPTADDKALTKLRLKDPLLRPICDNLSRYRSLGIAANVLRTPPDPDNRLRCSYSTSGTITFRFSSSENAFGGGTNFQNISSGEESSKGLEGWDLFPAPILLPNIRKIFIPDKGMVMGDMDLARADAQMVAGHAEDYELLTRFDDPSWDMHESNAKDICKAMGVSYYKEKHRPMAKAAVHAMNYGVGARTLAATLGCGMAEAQTIIDAWFSAHPLIKGWQHEVEYRLQTTRTISNIWGYSIQFFDRMSVKLLQEALAWIGQSSVAILINKIWGRLDELPWVTILLQVHDSLVFQIPLLNFHQDLDLLHEQSKVIIPFPGKQHIIDTGLKASTVSWGDCKGVSWPDAN